MSMINVKNKKCIRNLSKKSMKASRTRNMIAIIAIALTTVLFTSLFTIAISINDAFQDSNFRQVGGFSHGGFKYLSKEQTEDLKGDSLVKEYGVRKLLGMAADDIFIKSQVEVSYADKNAAHWMYCDLIEGSFPKEGTNEAATDLRVLELLGVEPKIGEKFTVTIDVDGKKTRESFVLSGYWEYDTVVSANHILLPESRVDEVIQKLNITPPGINNMTGMIDLNIMLPNAWHIEKDLKTILARHGYQAETEQEENYIAIGVNWGYTGAQMIKNFDAATVLSVGVILFLIFLTGYLIIYNIFQISVISDIHFYGLLKTIGTTKKQIKKIIRQQAFRLSGIGIPIGLILGWLIGRVLTPVILENLQGVTREVSSVNPIIFIISSVFSLVTVFFSCNKPAKIAAKVSPVEAVKYSEGSENFKKKRRKKRKFSIFSMAMANVGRQKGKTIVTVLSLSLVIVLLEMVITFTNGFDMDKYLRQVVSDFIVADARYFQVTSLWDRDQALPENVISDMENEKAIKKGGRVYGTRLSIYEYIEEKYYRDFFSEWLSKEELDEQVGYYDRDKEGRMEVNIELYGMEEYALEKVKVLDGDISKLSEKSDKSGKKKHYIAAVYLEGDYGEIIESSHWAKVGDKLKLRYVDEFEYYNEETGEIYEQEPENNDYSMRVKKYRDVEYEVAAIVTIPIALSYRSTGTHQFLLEAENFKKDTKTDDVMLYAFDTKKENTISMENFLKKYTNTINPQYDYESKESYRGQFETFRKMFLLLGSALSFIVGLIGILNFFNAILTGIITRRRELAVLQSVGMSGKQLKKMLIFEGMCYVISSLILVTILTVLTAPLISNIFGKMFWFFSYHFTILPILIVAPIFILLGVVLPLAVYRNVVKKSIVERIRDVY